MGERFDPMQLLYAEEGGREANKQLSEGLSNINGKLEDIKNEMEESKPIGIKKDYKIDVVPKRKKYEDLDWYSFTLFNDGPDPIYIECNERIFSETPIKKGESLIVESERRSGIKWIILFCDKDKEAKVRIQALR